MACVGLPAMPDAIPDAALAEIARRRRRVRRGHRGAVRHLQHDPSRPGGAGGRAAPAGRDAGGGARARRRAGDALHRHARCRWTSGAHHPDNATPAAWARSVPRDGAGRADGRGRRRRSRHRAGAGQRRDLRGRRPAPDRRDGLGADAHRARPGQPVRAGGSRPRRATSWPRPSTCSATASPWPTPRTAPPTAASRRRARASSTFPISWRGCALLGSPEGQIDRHLRLRHHLDPGAGLHRAGPAHRPALNRDHRPAQGTSEGDLRQRPPLAADRDHRIAGRRRPRGCAHGPIPVATTCVQYGFASAVVGRRDRLR